MRVEAEKRTPGGVLKSHLITCTSGQRERNAAPSRRPPDAAPMLPVVISLVVVLAITPAGHRPAITVSGYHFGYHGNFRSLRSCHARIAQALAGVGV
jgi:hypothetical protein